ncbi:MAG: histidinol-phosphatase HisJ family protein [Clostridia bacterium]|nr:histidinol-phosphatase HisJ family protein [Clostridia bacterium]
MYYADCHIHSIYSIEEIPPDDPSAQIDTICDAAVAAGMSEIAITDHYEVNLIVEEKDRKKADPEAAREAVEAAKEKYAGRLHVSFGVELGQPEEYPEHVEELFSKIKFDYALGSLHTMPGIQDFAFFDYANMSQEEIEDLFDLSLKYLMTICDVPQVNSLAHFNYMHKFVRAAGREMDFGKHYEPLRELYRKMIRNGKALEVNTQSMCVCSDLTLPCHELIRLYRETGGEMVTFGSDTHGIDDYGIGNGIKSTYGFLADTGFRYITVFHEGKPVMERIDR